MYRKTNFFFLAQRALCSKKAFSMLDNNELKLCYELANESLSFKKEINKLFLSNKNNNKKADNNNSKKIHKYYISYSKKNLFEFNHIKDTLTRKNRIVLMEKKENNNINFELCKDKINEADTFILLSSENNDELIQKELDYTLYLKEKCSKKIRIAIIQLEQNSTSNNNSILKLLGTDRVARELAMFRLIQEEE